MKTIKIAFYKYSKSFFWKLICWKQDNLPWRYARYSHTEIVFEDWQSFSSSEQDWWIRFKKIDFKKENWDFIEIKISEIKYNKILDFCKKQDWNEYNWLWIFFAQICNFNKKWNWDWFCSEIVTRALQEWNILCCENSLFTSPWQLAVLLENSWFYIL